jgi:hypothetical protein
MGATGFQTASFSGKHQAWVVDQVSVLVPREPPAKRGSVCTGATSLGSLGWKAGANAPPLTLCLAMINDCKPFHCQILGQK